MTYLYIVFGTSLFSIIFSVAAIIRVCTGTKNSFLIKLLLLLVLSNMAYNVSNFLFYYQVELDTFGWNQYVCIYVYNILAGIRDLCFNVAHWMYAYKYWFSSYHMQMIVTNKIISQTSEGYLQALNICMLLLIALNTVYLPYSGIICDVKIFETPNVTDP